MSILSPAYLLLHPSQREPWFFRSRDDFWELKVFLGAYGHYLHKPTSIYCTLDKRTKAYFCARPKGEFRKGARKVKSKCSGKVSIQGAKDLKESEHYPHAFCSRFVDVWSRFCKVAKAVINDVYIIQPCGAPLVVQPLRL